MYSTESKNARRVRTICRHLTSATSLGTVIDGYLVRPQCAPGLERVVGKTALSVVGGTVPLPQHEVARRAYRYALNPMQNPIKEVILAYDLSYLYAFGNFSRYGVEGFRLGEQCENYPSNARDFQRHPLRQNERR